MSLYYAYIHARPDGRVFYVGKGKEKRAYQLRDRGDYHQKVIDKYGAENILIGKLDCSSESIAFELEKGLIKCFRRMGVELTNRTDGGDGVLGLQHSDKTKQKLSSLFDDPSYAEKHSAAVKRAHVRSKEKYRKSAKESQNRPEVLARHKEYQGSLEVRAAKSAWAKAFWADAERSKLARERIEAAFSRPEVRVKKSQALLGKNRGKVSVMRGNVHRMIKPEALPLYLSQGWVRGNPSAKGRQTAKGRVWVTNSTVNRMVFPMEVELLLSNGWRRGRK